MSEKYYHTKESVDEYIQLAKDVNGQEHINQLIKYLEKGSSVLELGSGPGKDWDILNKTYQVVGSDYSKEFLAHLKAKYPNHEFIQLDASNLRTNLTFDGIYSNKVLHHLKDDELEQSVMNQANILNHNGIICHTFWKGTGTEEFKGMFVNYHLKNGLKKLFNPFFDIISLKEYQEFEEGDSIQLIARKK